MVVRGTGKLQNEDQSQDETLTSPTPSIHTIFGIVSETPHIVLVGVTVRIVTIRLVVSTDGNRLRSSS